MRNILCLVFLLLFGCSLSAQTNRIMITGVITDMHGMRLAGVSVKLKGTLMGTTSDEHGSFFFRVPEGSYLLQASAVGYRDTAQTVIAHAGQKTHCIITMHEYQHQMEEVIVTGNAGGSSTVTRMLLPVRNIPQSITVISHDIITQQAAFDLTTITRNVTGLNFTGNYSGSGSSQFFNARGFDLNSSQNYRLNGQMIWNLGNLYSDNIAEVEFLKGPASILYGDVAPGGVLNFVTKTPESQFHADLQLKTGSWGLFRPTVDLTGPATADRKLRYRLNTSFETSGSFRDHVRSKNSMIAPSLSWDIDPNLTIHAEVTLKNSNATDDAGLVSPDGTTAGLQTLDPSLYLGDSRRKYLFNDQSYLLTGVYSLSTSWQIKATAFIARTANRPFGIWFDQPDPEGYFSRREYGFYQLSNNRSVSVQSTGTLFTGAVKHRIVAGLDMQSGTSRLTNGGELSLLDSINIFHPVNTKTFSQEPEERPFQPYRSVIRRKGIFLQDHISAINERIQLLLGLRAGLTGQGNDYDQALTAGTGYEGYPDDIITKRILSPRAGLVYKLVPSTSIYVSYSTGYELNSPDLFAKNYKTYAHPPATRSTQVEAGVKTDLNTRINFTLSAFDINKRNPYGYVYLDPENPNFDEYEVYYDGHHRSTGIELEAAGRLSKEFSFNAGAGYTLTKVISDPGYPSGNRLANAPKFMASTWFNYEASGILKNFRTGAGLFYKGPYFSTLTNDRNLKVPEAYTVDLMAGYSYRSAGIQLNVMNLTNQVNYLNPWQFNLFDVAPLRRFVITMSYTLR